MNHAPLALALALGVASASCASTAATERSTPDAREEQATREQPAVTARAKVVTMVFLEDRPDTAQVEWLPAWGEHADAVRELAESDCPENVDGGEMSHPYLGCTFSFDSSLESNAFGIEALAASFSYISDALPNARANYAVDVETTPGTTTETMLYANFYSSRSGLHIHVLRASDDVRVLELPIAYMVDYFSEPLPSYLTPQRALIVSPGADDALVVCEQTHVQQLSATDPSFVNVSSVEPPLGGTYPSCPETAPLASGPISSDYAVFVQPSISDPDAFDDSAPWSIYMDLLEQVRAVTPSAMLRLPARDPDAADYE